MCICHWLIKEKEMLTMNGRNHWQPLEDLEDLESNDTWDKVQNILKQIGKKIWLILIVVLLAGFLFVNWRLSNARDRERSMEDKLKQNEEQLALQQQVIDGLRKRQEETESFTKNSIPVITSEQLKSELNSIQDLVTQQYIYTNADKYARNQTWIFGWERPFSQKTILVTYDGKITAGIDLKDVQPEVDEENHMITIHLPASKIISNEIPQESITVVEVKDGLFNDVTLDDYNDFISDQKIKMENKAIERGLLTEADAQARLVVTNFLNNMPGIGDPYTLTVETSKN